jgi:hypothetical protein
LEEKRDEQAIAADSAGPDRGNRIGDAGGGGGDQVDIGGSIAGTRGSGPGTGPTGPRRSRSRQRDVATPRGGSSKSRRVTFT